MQALYSSTYVTIAW